MSPENVRSQCVNFEGQTLMRSVTKVAQIYLSNTLQEQYVAEMNKIINRVSHNRQKQHNPSEQRQSQSPPPVQKRVTRASRSRSNSTDSADIQLDKSPSPPVPTVELDIDPTSERLVSKKSLMKLLAQIDAKETFDFDVEEV